MDDELRQYDAIRPYEPEELPEVYDKLLQDENFLKVVNYVLPGIPLEVVRQQLYSCKTSLEFQKKFCYSFLERVVKESGTSLDGDFSALDVTKNYTFISNHRDIVLDSAFLDKLLIDAGFSNTCEIAIGDNLFGQPWIRDFVRLNKSFVVERGLGMREMLVASQRLSRYMHYSITKKKENIWIAQREGRAKDSNDKTQESVLKMIAMGGDGSVVQRLKEMHIVPLAISYEYDACDYLKAKEFQQKRDDKEWRKTKADDILSMATGFKGFKGRIVYKAAPCIDSFLDTLPEDMSKTEVFEVIAQHIDEAIYNNYNLYPCNYIALDLLEGTGEYRKYYTQEEKTAFVDYINQQVDKVDLVRKDEAFLEERLLTMYANPARNQLKQRKD